MDFRRVNSDRRGQCYQMHWQQEGRENRKYWNYIDFTPMAVNQLNRCPAATSGYQLFRQQALAEALVKKDDFDLVVSCVAYDRRNKKLVSCLRTTGIDDFRSDWAGLFQGDSVFATFAHQDWFRWVNDHDSYGRWADWSKFISERYDF